MAGITAGRLSIEIVAEIARLQADLDKAKRAVKAASGDIANSARAANDNIAKMGGSSKIAGHHLANLSFQLQDIVVGLKSGQKPMTVFLQQGGQIAQIMGQAGIGVGGLAKAIGGMVLNFAKAHPVLVALGAVAGTAAAGFNVFADQVNSSHKSELDAYAASLGLTTKQIEKAGGAAVTAGDMIGGLWDVIRDGLGLQSVFDTISGWIAGAFIGGAMKAKDTLGTVYAAAAATVDAIRAIWPNIGPILGNAVVAGINVAISAIEKLVNSAIDGLNQLTALADPWLAKFGMAGAGHVGPVRFDRAEFGAVATGTSAADAFASAYQKRLQQVESGFNRFFENWGEAGVNRRNQRLLGAVEKEAEKAGKNAGKKMAENFGLTFAEAFAPFAEDFKAITALQGDKASTRERIEALRREAKAVGLVGWERDRLLTLLQGTAEISTLQARLTEAENAGLTNQANDLRDLIKLRAQELELKLQTGDAEEVWKRAENAARDYNDSLRDIIGSLQQIGGVGGVLAGLLGIASGNTSALRGPIGDLLNVNIQPLSKEVRRLGDVLSDAVDQLGTSLAAALQSAGLGILGANGILGKQGAGGMIGAGIGGILGGMASGSLSKIGGVAVEKAFGVAAGKIASDLISGAVPIIGGIIGSIGGKLLGKLIGGASRGSAIISGGSVSGTYGDTQAFKDQATEAANGLLDTLGQIASQFGTTLDKAAAGSLSFGIRDGNFIIDPLGRGFTKTSKYPELKSFGKDADAAAQYAIKLMLERGAIAMREGSLKIIKSATDLNEGLQKALKFEEIMNQLENGSSELVGQVKSLRAQFGDWISVMKEAGASVEDLTRVQAMQAEKIKALIDAAGDSYRSTFYSDAQNLAFAKQQIASVLTPLGHGDIDTVAEYMRAVEAAQKDTTDAGLAWLDTLYSLTDAFGTLKAASEAAAAQREAEAAQALAEHQQLVDATVNDLRQAIEGQRSFADSMRALRAELFASEGQADSYASKLANLRRVGGMAALGSPEAQQQLEGAIRDFLPAALAHAGSALEYQRDLARAAQYASNAASAADMRANQAQQLLDQQMKATGNLVEINSGIRSLNELMQQLLALTGGTAPAPTSAPRNWATPEAYTMRTFDGFEMRSSPRHSGEDTATAIEGLRDELREIKKNTSQSATSNTRTARVLRRNTRLGRGSLSVSEAPA